MKPYLFLLLVICAGCSSTMQKVRPSKFMYNDRPLNVLIENRIPVYPDGFRGQRLRLRQFQVSIKTQPDSAIAGVVQDVITRKPLGGTNIMIWFRGENNPKTLVADEQGTFRFSRSRDVVRMEVRYAGWRPMTLDLSRTCVL